MTLLVGLAANAVAGRWWAGPLAASLMVPWLVKEGKVWRIRREDFQAFRVKHGDVPPSGGGMTYDPDQL